MECHQSQSWSRRVVRFLAVVVLSMLAGKVIETLTSKDTLREIQKQATNTVREFAPWEMASRYVDILDGKWNRREERDRVVRDLTKQAHDLAETIAHDQGLPRHSAPRQDIQLTGPDTAIEQIPRPRFEWNILLPLEALAWTLVEISESSKTAFLVAVAQLCLGAMLTAAIRLSASSKPIGGWFWLIGLPMGSVVLGSILAGVVLITFAFLSVLFHEAEAFFYQVGFYIAAGVEFGRHCFEVASHKKIETVIERVI